MRNVTANALLAQAIVDRGVEIIDAGVERGMDKPDSLGLARTPELTRRGDAIVQP